MKGTRKTLSLIIGMSSLFVMGFAIADCLDSITPQNNGSLTFSDLVKYDKCMKTEMAATQGPLKLSQSTWEAACSGGAFSSNKCFGDNPATNTNTLLALKVTNIYAIANLSLTATYPSGSIWIGQFPAGVQHSNQTNAGVVAAGEGVQVICAPYTEIGWGVPKDGIYTNTFSDTTNSISMGGQYSATSNNGTALPGFKMMSTGNQTTQTPFYIICVGRNTADFTPAALNSNFEITWS